MHIETLVTQIESCTLCSDLPLGPKPLFKVNPSARILIAGQAPGRKTHEKGVPFDDASGDRLRAWMGVERTVFYGDPRIAILPMGLCYPGTTATGDKPPRPECAPAWRKEVLSHLDNVSLTIVMGRYALNWHVPKHKGASIAATARALATPDARTLLLPHPSPRNNRWLRKNTWFEEAVVPLLQRRVKQELM